MKHTSILLAAALAVLVLSSVPAARADEAPAAPAPAATPAPAPAAASAAPEAAPLPGRAVRPGGSSFDSLPEAEKEHIRKMAGFRSARDEAERDLLRLRDEAAKRKEAILAENEEAKTLYDRIRELETEFAAATNALETIYREDEALAGMVAKAEELQKAVDAAQTSLNHEVATAMQIRMAAQRAAYEKAHPAPPPLDGAAATNQPVRSAAPLRPNRAPGPGTPFPRPFVPGAPAPAPAAPAAPAPAPAPAPAE